jgi:hypothetical protein
LPVGWISGSIHQYLAQEFLMNKPARGHRFVEPIQKIYPTGKSLLVIRKYCQAPESKIFLFIRNNNQAIGFSIPSHSEGHCARSPVRDGDAVDADGAPDQSA